MKRMEDMADMADQSLETDKSTLETSATSDKNSHIKKCIKLEHSGLHQDLAGSAVSIEQKFKSLVPHRTATSALLASQLAVPDSITSLAQRYKDLIPHSTATSTLLASQLAVPDSITSLAQRYKDLMPHSTATSTLLASQLAMPDSIKSITSLAQRYKDLMPHSTVTSTLLASQLAMPDSIKSITSLAQRYKDLMPHSTATSTLLGSQLAMPDSIKSITSLAQRYKDLIPHSTATSTLLAPKLAVPDSIKNITSLAQRYKDLIPHSTAVSTLVRSWGLRRNEFNSISELYNPAGKFLENISTEELNAIVNATSIYTRTAKGAAYIAQNTAHFNDIEPDAIAKLEEFKNKNIYIKKFRELPLIIQLMICYFITRVCVPIIEDTIKSEALYLFNKAGDLVIQALPMNVYMKELLAKKNDAIDWETLKNFRVVTADNVRLRNKPSMQGEVIELIGKYSVIAVLDKSDRKWLYVKISLNGEEIYGWINRSYTKPLKSR